MNFGECGPFPTVWGVDAKHILIKAPQNAGSDFFKFKGIQSTKYCFTMVDIVSYGRESDGGIFKDSIFGSRLLHGTLELPQPENLAGTNIKLPHVLLGDAAFPLHVNLVHPYSGRLRHSRVTKDVPIQLHPRRPHLKADCVIAVEMRAVPNQLCIL
ncbi:hypothetical protein F2P79_024362 [Pimephales promelas]|nr:hypothetical protein F2P79_024362 [Pimephales promelas]